MHPIGLAIEDLKKTVLQYPLWSHLGYIEVKQRYRRSVLGPWWATISLLIFIVMMGVVFSRLFQQSLNEYIPFFTAGFIFWTFISSSLIEAADIFRTNAGFIKQINLPYHVYLFKFLTRQMILLVHNSTVYLLVCLFFQFNPGWKIFLIFPGFLLLLINVYWATLLIAILCARYQDIVPLIGTCVQVAFFVTPISWMPRLLDPNSQILKLNPLTYLLDLVRSPLLGKTPALMSWSVCCSLALVGCALTLLLFAKMRSRIAFWVD